MHFAPLEKRLWNVITTINRYQTLFNINLPSTVQQKIGSFTQPSIPYSSIGCLVPLANLFVVTLSYDANQVHWDFFYLGLFMIRHKKYTITTKKKHLFINHQGARDMKQELVTNKRKIKSMQDISDKYEILRLLADYN